MSLKSFNDAYGILQSYAQDKNNSNELGSNPGRSALQVRPLTTMPSPLGNYPLSNVSFFYQM